MRQMMRRVFYRLFKVVLRHPKVVLDCHSHAVTDPCYAHVGRGLQLQTIYREPEVQAV